MFGAFEIELHQALILGWLMAGGAALWIAHKLHLSRAKTINILLPMALGLVIFTLYVSTRFNYDFLIDDVDIIQTNPDVKSADGWRTLWQHDYWSGRSPDQNLYRPVTILSYWVNARLPRCAEIVNGEAVQMAPRYFRGVNMLLLLGLSWVLALWLTRYVQQAAAWTVAFLFAAHPAHGEMVNYVVCRADLLAMLGVLGFLLMHRLSLEQGRWRWWQAGLAVLAAVVAFGSKESGLILIPAAFAQMWIGPRNASTDIIDDIAVTPKRVHLASIVFLLLPAVAYFAMRTSVVGAGMDYAPTFVDDIRDNPLRMVPLAERIPAAISIAWFYTRQIFNPDTSYYHIPETLPTWTTRETILGLMVILFSVILAWALIRRRSWLLLGLILAAGQYVLVGNLLLPVGVYAANRLILPFSIAAAMLLAAFLHAKCGHSTRSRAAVLLPTAAVMIVMAFTLLDVNTHWATESRLLGRDFRLDPENAVDKYNFGTVRARDGKRAHDYTQALQSVIEMLAILQKDPSPTARTREELRPVSIRLHEFMDKHSDSDENIRQIRPLRDAVVLVDRVLAQEEGMAVTPGDIDTTGETVRDDLLKHHMLTEKYWSEARVLLEGVVIRRPHSRSAALELGKVYEYLDEPEKARVQYERVVEVAQTTGVPRAFEDVKVVEAHLRAAWLWMEVRNQTDTISPSRHLLAAEQSISGLLDKREDLPAGHVLKLEELYRVNQLYLAKFSAQLRDIPSAQRRLRNLLLKFPDYEEARAEMARLIDLGPGGSLKPESSTDHLGDSPFRSAPRRQSHLDHTANSFGP